MKMDEAQLHYEFNTFRRLLDDPSFWLLDTRSHKRILKTLDHCWLTAELTEEALVKAALEYQALLTQYVDIAQLPNLKGPIC